MPVTFSPVGDFSAVCDGLQAVTLTDREGTTEGLESGLRRKITEREAAASNGKYTTQDVRWNLSQSEVTLALVPGCTITDADDAEWTVLSVERATLGDRWACVCRNLVVTEGLDTLIAIQVSTPAKGPTGAHVDSWEYLLTDVRAKFQRVAAGEESERGARRLTRDFICFLREQVDLRGHHRIIDADGKAYRVTGYRDPERIDKLSEVDLVLWQENASAGGAA